MEDAGGPGLEYHQFDHIDMPLDEVCGLSQNHTYIRNLPTKLFRILDSIFLESLQMRKKLRFI